MPTIGIPLFSCTPIRPEVRALLKAPTDPNQVQYESDDNDEEEA